MSEIASVDLTDIGQAAKAASRKLSIASEEQRNATLRHISETLEDQSPQLLEQNALDLEKGQANSLGESLLDRLRLSPSRISALASDVRKIAEMAGVVGEIIEDRQLENGLRLLKKRVPIGVIGVIYEARPNVTIDVAALCLKTANTAILRGGTETIHSNLALVRIIQEALVAHGLPEAAVQYVENPDRALVGQLLKMNQYVDMIVPRGGEGLHRLCREQSTIPVITGGIGICHIFVDESADLKRAVDIVENAKTQRPSVCNALDTLLVHRAVADQLLPEVVNRLSPLGVELRAEKEAFEIMEKLDDVKLAAAGPEDFDREWLSLILGVKVVGGIEEAIAHIQEHSTEHSDSILTQNQTNADRFVEEVDSAAVYVNASTRFTDGGQFGLGAEVAVSTQKLHARGPMGLGELTTYKWIGIGDGLLRE